MKIRTLILEILCSLILLNGCNAQTTRNGCYVSNFMISCLSILCEFGGSCPGDPDAICRVERPDKCAGCEQVWYSRDGTLAKCGSRQNLALCPGGEPVVHCKVDSCKWPCTHPAFQDKPCRQNFCGRCKAEYLIGDKWLSCPRSTTGFSGETLPVDLAIRDRTSKACMYIPCPLDSCVGHTCLKYPEASCRPDGCNKCLPAWFLGNKPVDCQTGELFPPVAIEPIDPLTGTRRVCPGGEALMTCTDSVCLGQTCPNYPRAVCKPDGCGQCKATWYDDNVLVDCFATECPANVMRVRCIVDPCIYFGHYCPAAECRASECGRCEAKFYVGSKEISCVQPPKKCQPGENTMNCPWYTCPHSVCPSNLNLMCRINPCGLSCTREWVNVKTGNLESCRTFEAPPRSESDMIFMQDPLAGFHDNTLTTGQKPFIEVKKIPATDTTTIKTSDTNVVPPYPGAGSVPIPMSPSKPLEAQPTSNAGQGASGDGKVVILGGNDPAMNNMLLEILGAGKGGSPASAIGGTQTNIDPAGPITNVAGDLPPPMPAGKAVIDNTLPDIQVPDISPIVNQHPVIDTVPAGTVVDKTLVQITKQDIVPPVPSGPVAQNNMPPVDQNPVPLVKPAVKPVNNQWPLTGGQTNPNFGATQPLYPELGLIQTNASNQRWRQRQRWRSSRRRDD